MSHVIKRLLIANRGEIAVRIARIASELGIETFAIYSEEDAHSGHLRHADHQLALKGSGAAAYLDSTQIIALALAEGCDAIHPGYGFLSENAEFARACAEENLLFVGPTPETLDLLGDKTRARALAESINVPVNPGSAAATLIDAQSFFAKLEPGEAMIIKAVAGGGGKGMRVVRKPEELASSFERCQSEALRAFGSGAVYVEKLIEQARHIEVQIVGDGLATCHLWDRDCSLQRQHQKLIEFAPALHLDGQLRDQILQSALQLAQACRYRNIGTFEFLVDSVSKQFVFLEANPRLQVEHTVTDTVLGLDLVEIQLAIASGRSLAELGLTQEKIPAPRACAMQLRINMESMDAQGRALPSGGTLRAFVPPQGPGIRVDSFAYSGYQTVGSFDSLLAKLIVSECSGDLQRLFKRALRALSEFELQGVDSNRDFLQQVLRHPDVARLNVSTRWIEAHIDELLPEPGMRAGAQEEGSICAPMSGVLSQVLVEVGDQVAAESPLALIEAMKLEHEILAPFAGVVVDIALQAGAAVGPGSLILTLAEADDDGARTNTQQTIDPDAIRADLAEVQALVAATQDANRPKAVQRRRDRGQRTARENIADLCDEGSFIEYGQLAVAFLHSRKSHDELRETTPADGFVAGLATINASLFGEENASIAIGAYDATVMAGTQGYKNHQKSDRLFDLAGEQKLPLVLFAEGGGGRPREDPVTIAALQSQTFRKLAELSGKVPIVGVVSGRCFAGNAALLGMADVIIATENSNIGMAGPALIEAGGLGQFAPEDIGPIDVQHNNGVVDIRVRDEAEAVAVTRRYLSYFQGPLADWSAPDQRLLRQVVPENRLRAYDVRKALYGLADNDSVLELRSAYGRAYVTALARVEGKPMGVIANNPAFNSGAIDSDSADKAASFMRLCDAHGLPILSLIDTPGIMVGPEAEQTALVRHSAKLFIAAAGLRVPLFAIVLRKAYGLGAMAAAGGNFHAPVFTIAWPTGELGGMGLEGGVRLAYKKEMEAIEDPAEREAYFEKRVASRYRKGKASFIASYFELDAVIDPAESRLWIRRGLAAMHKP